MCRCCTARVAIILFVVIIIIIIIYSVLFLFIHICCCCYTELGFDLIRDQTRLSGSISYNSVAVCVSAICKMAGKYLSALMFGEKRLQLTIKFNTKNIKNNH